MTVNYQNRAVQHKNHTTVKKSSGQERNLAGLWPPE